jgi:hypothetical protein
MTTTQYTMREPCRKCGSSFGEIRTTSGQDCVYCVCGAWAYNAPRAETGRAVRPLTDRTSIPTSKRYRVLERASGRCELCGAREGLVVDHILSLQAGAAQGWSDFDLNHDDNLAALCAACNAGKGAIPMSPRLYVALLKSRAS